jgi:hypothetical protein
MATSGFGPVRVRRASGRHRMAGTEGLGGAPGRSCGSATEHAVAREPREAPIPSHGMHD